MATFRATKGQTAKAALVIQFTDGTGAAIDPTGTVTLTVYYADPAGSLVSKASVNPTKQLTKTGFYASFLDISNVTTYPAGDYVLRWEATVAAVATSTEDYFEIDDAWTGSGSSISGAYCSEADVRGVTTALGLVADIASAVITEKAGHAARWIDGRLRARYDVPFAGPPYDDTIVILNMWLAAADSLRFSQGQRGNDNALGAELRAQVDAAIEDILNGTLLLSVDPTATLPAGASMPDGFARDRVFSRDADVSDLGRF